MTGTLSASYEGKADDYENERFSSPAGAYQDQQHRRTISALISSVVGKRVIDVGCGTGRFTIETAESGAQSVGIDLSIAMLRRLRENALQQNLQNRIDLVQSDVLDLGFRRESFDVCTCVNLVHLVNDYTRLLREINRILKLNGVLVMNFPNIIGWYLPVGVYVRLTGKSFAGDVASRWFTYFEIARALRNAGFRIEDCRGHLVIPPSTSATLLPPLSVFDLCSRSSPLRFLSGSVFVKAVKVADIQ